eukprot:1192181-Prorocentrum_minimum.AAC.2
MKAHAEGRSAASAAEAVAGPIPAGCPGRSTSRRTTSPGYHHPTRVANTANTAMKTGVGTEPGYPGTNTCTAYRAP